MTQNIPYLRKVELRIGPLAEWQGGGGSNQAIIVRGDGTQTGFRIKFECHKHVMETATPTVIHVYNLSQEIRNALRQSYTQVALFVGWENVDPVLLFTGSLLAAVHQRQGPDIVTNLISNSAFGGMARTYISATFAGGTTIKSIILDLARKIPGVTVDPKNVGTPAVTRMGTIGWSTYGTVDDCLNRLSRVYGFNWRIENKIFYAEPHGQPLPNSRVVISNSNGFLLRAEPMLSGPQQVKAGVSIRSLLNPFIPAGGLVDLNSAMNPSLNGTYVVHSLSHFGDTHGTQWDTGIESWVTVN